MNKQEAIDKIKGTLKCENTRHLGKVANVYGVIDIIKQIDEPEKPIVPQFVADWYEDNKDGFEYKLYRLCIDFHERKLHEDLHEWFTNNKNKPLEVLISMNKYGYEVEKEKRYTVELPNPNGVCEHVMLAKYSGKVCIVTYQSPDCNEFDKVKLTEAEIKKDFEWAWQFAKEVKE